MPAAKAIDASVAAQRTVLVVEDVAAVRLLMADIVRSFGYSVLEASNGEEAIHVIERSAVHVVLSDVYMPNAPIDGLQLAHWIHDQRPRIKVILTSGVVSAVDPAYADFHEGPLLQKPVKPQELERRLRSTLGDNAECR
jgi:CheY-like chemotaxis protein